MEKVATALCPLVNLTRAQIHERYCISHKRNTACNVIDDRYDRHRQSSAPAMDTNQLLLRLLDNQKNSRGVECNYCHKVWSFCFLYFSICKA